MTKKGKPIPDGFRTVTPHLSVKHADKAIQFYEKAFGAKEMEKHLSPDGRVLHATIKIGDSVIMLADEFPEYGCGIASPHSLKGSTTVIHLYVEDVDTLFSQAIKAGATEKMPVEDMFWGDRYGQLEDPFGHQWSIATHLYDVTADDVEQGSSGCCQGKKSSPSCCG